MARALVTGANGFLGSWLVKRLNREGLDVRILCRTKSDLSELEGAKYEKSIGDVTDQPSLEAAMKDVDHVFHAAAVIGYKSSEREQMERVNVHGTNNVVRVFEKSNAKSMLYVSSVVAVGASMDGKRPLNENDPYLMSPYNFGYFETKKKAEDIVLAFAKSSGRKIVTVNPSTVYGAGDARKGSRKVQLKVAQGRFKFYTSGGVSIVAVEDVVEGIWQAFNKGRSGERYILSGENLTIKILFERIAHFAGSKPPSIYLPNSITRTIGLASDILESLGLKGPLNSESAYNSILFHWFDHTKAARELGFTPRPADYALEASVRWSRDNGLL